MKKVNSTTIRKKYPREKDYIVWEYEDSFNTMYVYKDFIEKGQLQKWNERNFPSTVKQLQIRRKNETDLPACTYDFPNLEYLLISPQLIKKIDWSHFKNLIALQTEKLNWTMKDEIFPNLLYLCVLQGSIKFKQKNLPKLRSISCKYSDEVMNELLYYKRLDETVFYAVNNTDVLDQLSGLEDLNRLSINSGKIISLKGISKIRGVEYLQIATLSHLTDISELAEMDSLQELWINTCKYISSWEFLLEMKSLKKLSLFSCGKIYPNEKILSTLKGRGVKVF
ncbi:hypothetical protein [Capnocytophaga sputigena]|uniref:hypothetical protein n=1 Tax=Capnocytophaga sputigena TaxID=1019 RepID=UPI0028D8F97E|nr:hypothetical protein [Capnocytophaga sputigena]